MLTFRAIKVSMPGKSNYSQIFMIAFALAKRHKYWRRIWKNTGCLFGDGEKKQFPDKSIFEPPWLRNKK